MKTGLIFVRPLKFESVAFLEKTFQPIKSQDSIARKALWETALSPRVGSRTGGGLRLRFWGETSPHFGTKCAVNSKTGTA
jgi:hypothetical protein